MKKSQIKKVLLFYILAAAIILFISKSYIDNAEEKLLNQKYTTISKKAKELVENLIKDKKNATLAFAIATSNDKSIQNILKEPSENKINKLDFYQLSLRLKRQTDFNNVWFQIIDKNNKTIYRSWEKIEENRLQSHANNKNILITKKINISISINNFDMTFKVTIPIFEKGEYLGFFEVITHFNSIHERLKNNEIDLIAIANKHESKKIKYPFTNNYLEGHYIANLNANKKLIHIIKKEKTKSILKIENFRIVKNRLITVFPINEFNEKNIGFLILSKKLNSINTQDIEEYKKNAFIFVLITILGIGFLIIFITYNTNSKKIHQLNKKLKNEIKKSTKNQEKKQQILDSQQNIILITDGEKLQKANKQLLKFFNEFKNFETFKENYECICEAFIDMNDDMYVLNKDYEGKNWAEYILENSEKKFRAAMKRNNQIHHFTLNVNLNQFEDEDVPYIIVTLTDITHEIITQEKLKDLNENLEMLVEDKTKELIEVNKSLEFKIEKELIKSKEKDRILFRQNKMASMGEMLNNIAHQWRQPLNAVTTAASSIVLKSELNNLDKASIQESCHYILKHSNYLSQTIENFRNFFKEDEEKQHFLLRNALNENIEIIKGKLSSNKIELVLDDKNDFKFFGYKKEFQQAILNILENSIDALSKNKDSKKLIIIEIFENSFLIKDNAGGVKEEIIEKIFEPYFTTKHQSQGVGIGLYMAQEILTKHMNCYINTKNTTFKYKDQLHHGLCFEITFKTTK